MKRNQNSNYADFLYFFFILSYIEPKYFSGAQIPFHPNKYVLSGKPKNFSIALTFSIGPKDLQGNTKKYRSNIFVAACVREGKLDSHLFVVLWI